MKSEKQNAVKGLKFLERQELQKCNQLTKCAETKSINQS